MNTTPYIDWMFSSMPATLLEWIDHDRLRSALARDVEETIEDRMRSTERAEGYTRLCPVDGATPAEYHLRELEIAPDASLLAGIHFRNLNLDHPFVGIYAQSRSLSDEETLHASQLLAMEFERFDPEYVSWWSPEQHDLRTLPGAIADTRLVVGRLDQLDLRSTPLPGAYTLHRDDGGSYDVYSRMHDDYIDRYPEWRTDLAKTSESDYIDCARDGLVCRLEHAGRLAGIIAARHGEIRGIDGWEMLDEILDAEFRGKGLAIPMQRTFLSMLDRNEHAIVFGTINARNTASLRTALGVGRRDVGGWYFLSQLSPLRFP